MSMARSRRFHRKREWIEAVLRAKYKGTVFGRLLGRIRKKKGRFTSIPVYKRRGIGTNARMLRVRNAAYKINPLLQKYKNMAKELRFEDRKENLILRTPQRIYRSLYKPRVPYFSFFDSNHLSEKRKAFLRVDDLFWREGKIPIRLLVYDRSSFITESCMGYRILVYDGQIRLRFFPRDPLMIGHRIGEFIYPKRVGNGLHIFNKTYEKMQKRYKQLQLDAKRRKRRKKAQIKRPTPKGGSVIRKHSWVKEQAQAFHKKQGQKQKHKK